MDSIESIKSDMWLRASLRNLKDEKYKDNEKKIAEGLSQVPVKKMYDQAIFLDKDLLPRIEKSRGKNSEEYRLYTDIFKSLLYAIVLVDRNELMERRFSYLQLQHELLLQHTAAMEKQLTKYATMEDLLLNPGFDAIATGIVERARSLLK